MDIDGIHKRKGKYNSYKGKGKGKGKNKGKGYGGYNGYGYNSYNISHKGKGKYGGKGFNNYNNNPIGFGNPFGRGNKGNKGFSRQYTTLDKEKATTLRMRQHNGTMTTMTMDGTVRPI